MFDQRDLTQKMQDQEKAIQRKEDREAAMAKSEAMREKTAAAPRITPRVGTTNDTDWKFHIEQRLSEISGQLIHLTGLIVDRLPKPSALATVAANAPAALKTVEGGHPVLSNGKPALFTEVPSYETVMKYAKSYKERHGGTALKDALDSFNVPNISSLTEEQRAAFLERVNDEKPEGL
jgi:hypothetical protein